MSSINWQQILGWTPEQLAEIRFAGFSFLKEGRYEKALLFYRALLVLDPTSSHDAQTLGALYLQIGDSDAALRALEIALAMDPSHESTLLNKAKALLMVGQKKEALDLCRTLQKSKEQTIANDASALIQAYT